MKPCWRGVGLTEKGAELADSILPEMIGLVQRVDSDIARIVLIEATFRLFDLPHRSAAFQRKYLRTNGAPRSGKK